MLFKQRTYRIQGKSIRLTGMRQTVERMMLRKKISADADEADDSIRKCVTNRIDIFSDAAVAASEKKVPVPDSRTDVSDCGCRQSKCPDGISDRDSTDCHGCGKAETAQETERQSAETHEY